ncbi:MAG TPA: 50S ribosomal protein L10, partial [Actinobacteria bacterium]|nr:50S ribosomal protein L10 [Actinomycetota bacterium]
MPKTEKVEKVRVLTERFRTAGGAMFTEYRGLTVKDVTELRGELRKSDATFAVVKNTLTRRAATDAGLGNVVELLHGPTAVAFLGSDPVSGAKALLEAA